MTKFRPCIDLHQGRVKQIVGGSLGANDQPVENHVSDQSAGEFARMYRESNASGGHVIQLGPGNGTAAKEALAAWPGGLQIGGGIRPDNAAGWLEDGASHVIVTSWLFDAEAKFSAIRLRELLRAVPRENLVIDLSCRRVDDGWNVAMNRWQTLTNLSVTESVLDDLAEHCQEFLVHAADVEGLQQGIDEELVHRLGAWGRRSITYAGGARSLDDLARVDKLSRGNVDLTIGSALDIFGGPIAYADCVAWNQTGHAGT